MYKKTDLLEKPALLDDVGNCLHLYTFCFVDVLEGIKILGLLMLHHPDLSRGQQ